jgi:hypothetical protein
MYKRSTSETHRTQHSNQVPADKQYAYHIYGKFLDLCWNEQNLCVIHKEPCLERTLHEGHPVVIPADLSHLSC